MTNVFYELKMLLLDLLKELTGILPYFLAGVAIEAFIRTYKLHVKIRHALTRFGFTAIFMATFLGTLSPLCACGILPLTISLLIGGLPLAPAMSLLVSSPLMSPAGYMITKWELGLGWANAKLIASIFMGIYAGTITYFLSKYYNFETENLFKKELPKGDFHDHDYPVENLRCFCGEQFSNRIAQKTNNNLLIFFAKAYEGCIAIGKFALLGIIIEVIGARYIPAEWIEIIFGMKNFWITIPLIILLSIPLHINQISSVAILGGVLDKLGNKLSPGAGLAFLIGGPVTALPVMAIFISLFKKRVFFLYILICFTGSVIVSYFYQMLTFVF
ncbi:permease [Candidatus Desantisbacteria bacterium]|nr:permease [Candidatus Desantisbacteria bacterium]